MSSLKICFSLQLTDSRDVSFALVNVVGYMISDFSNNVTPSAVQSRQRTRFGASCLVKNNNWGLVTSRGLFDILQWVKPVLNGEPGHAVQFITDTISLLDGL